ncbi:hypothetical protein [Vibrio vulnificus]|uniref:hypothetical protein n=1 Tax=Vibrio vulnificus TaxID=672 RepID=UPI00057609D2|nr:hypothetical protein [Vibrio vulnificus]EGQ8024292.1 hypothetical protein [Vibrio vulnificus]MCA3949667.1 hypothetical protein [Vibrio vulnificus]RZQ76001.1 hypothetical protein D8T30_06440 [Vibrio vulnificus]RZR01549.1 hypothetical protein D8T29_06310 [Vibrio vulnificus]RZR44246.1 hypothetical protein D8T35_21635 [Vibrio vulnificus]
MGHKLPPEQLELYKRIDEILYYKWDPIGVSDSGWARDEYQSYLPQLFSLVMKSQSPQEICKYLTESTQYMGLQLSRDLDLAIAKLILEVKDSLDIE